MSEKQQVLPFQPVIDKLRGINDSDCDFALALGVSRDVMRNWVKRGIRFYRADKLACSLGHHPSYFWPKEYWDLPETTESEDKISA
jgi:hypothetical protein